MTDAAKTTDTPRKAIPVTREQLAEQLLCTGFGDDSARVAGGFHALPRDVRRMGLRLADFVAELTTAAEATGAAGKAELVTALEAAIGLWAHECTDVSQQYWLSRAREAIAAVKESHP
jgi:hypothetical protein